MSTSSVEEGVELEPAVNGTSRCTRYRDLPNRSSNEALKLHSTFAVKLSETGTRAMGVGGGGQVAWGTGWQLNLIQLKVVTFIAVVFSLPAAQARELRELARALEKQ